ncbi:MAG: flavin monoamine oxidase family protein [Polyangiaceae bacterium]
MARSPVMKGLLRLFRANRAATAKGIPLAEYVQMETEARALSRRRFLEASAAGAGFLTAAGASAMTGCTGDDTNPALPPSDSGSDATLDGSSAADATSGPDGVSDASTGPITDANGNVQTQIAIVGGGMAGMHCAYRLKKDYALTAQVYDANSVLGGRVTTDTTTFPDGMHVELGGELIDTDQTVMHTLAAELGITLNCFTSLVDPDGGLVDPYLAAGLGATYFGGQISDSAGFFAQFQPIADAINASMAPLTGTPSYMNANGGTALDSMSLQQWFDANNLSGPAVDILTVAYVTEFGLDAEVNNCLNMLLTLYPATGPSDDAGVLGNSNPDGGAPGFSIFGVSDELYTTQTGNHTYIDKMAAYLNPAQITLGAMLTRITQTAAGKYVLDFASGGSSFTVTADHVVLAIPFTTLRTVDTSTIAFPTAKRKAINELGYGNNAKLMCGFSSKPWRSQGSEGLSFTDLPYQSSWETSRLQPGASGIITVFTGGSGALATGNVTAQEQYEAFLPQWDQVFPNPKSSPAANNVFLSAFWPGNPLTKGSYAAYLVGQYTTISGAEPQRFNNIHFCGEHCSVGSGYANYTDDFQGFMAGAAGTGAAVAAEIASDLGLGEEGRYKVRRRNLFVPPSSFAKRFG